MSTRQSKVIFINPNPRTMSLVQPVVSLFYGILKKAGIEMKFFDTTLYDLTDNYIDPEKINKDSFLVRTYDDSELKNKVDTNSGENLYTDFRRLVEKSQPTVILASATESTMNLTRDILSSVMDYNIPHVLGGVFATYSPEVAIEYSEIDIVCVGESENILVELVERLTNNRKINMLPGVWGINDGVLFRNPVGVLLDLDNNPDFSVEIYEENRFYRAMGGEIYKMFPVETHRGCPLKCSFCNSPTQNLIYEQETGEKYFRSRSIKNIIKDVEIFSNNGAEYLFFWADNLLAWSKDEVDEFCEAYSDYKIPFYAQSYPTTLNEYKLNKLVDVGLARLGMGVEHGNEEFRTKIVNRKYSNEKAIRQVEMLRNYDVQYSCNYIVGFPDETPELHMDTVELNRKLKPHSASCSIFSPFCGTPLRDYTIKKGYLKDTNQLCPSNAERSMLDMPNFSKDQITGKQRTFALYTKFPRDRWNEIKKAEELTGEGDAVLEELRREYLLL